MVLSLITVSGLGDLKLTTEDCSHNAGLYEIPGDIGVKIRREWGETVVLCASCGFQSGNRVSTHGLRRVSNRQYFPWQSQPVQSLRFEATANAPLAGLSSSNPDHS